MQTLTSRFSRTLAAVGLLVALVAGAASAGAGTQVPFLGTASGSVVSVEPTSSGVLLTIHATGNATQLGKFTRVEKLLLDPSTGAFTGSIVFSAANQDQLLVSMVGGFISPTTAVGTYTILSGTGRFAGASGSADFVAESPDGIQVGVQFEGTISTVGG